MSLRPPIVLSVPGYTGAGPEHWLTHWERMASPELVRVEQRDWEDCDPEEWAKRLDEVINSCSQPPYFVAHSLGCLTVVEWAKRYESTAVGAILVAPPDVNAMTCIREITTFRPIPISKLQFPTLVIASDNDPHCSLERAQQISSAWGADFLSIGSAGHIATSDGFGAWPEGHNLLREKLDL